jgi:hypothetical protein
MEYKYDVAFSFSVNDREYVDNVAKILKENGIKVFYDKFEEINLWGKDLGLHFDYVYRKAAKYCVIFISTSYKETIWTNHEIKTAISRAIESNEEYILPVRFDNVEIEGIRPTLGFIDLRNISPSQFAEKVIFKLGKEPTIPIIEKEQDSNGGIYLAANMIISNAYGFVGSSLGVTITNIEKNHRYFNQPYFKLSEDFDEGIDTFYATRMLRPLQFPVKLEYGQVASVDYELAINSLDMIWNKLSEDSTVQAIVTTTVGERYKSNSVPVANIRKLLEKN